MGLMQDLSNIKECLQYDIKAVINHEKDIKEYTAEMDKEGFNKHGVYLKTFIETHREMIIKRKNDILNDNKEILRIETEINTKLKHFKTDLKPKTKGMLLKVLDKYTRYNGSIKVYRYFELVEKAINENLNVNFSFKTITNNLNYSFDDDLNKWVNLNNKKKENFKAFLDGF